MSRLIQFPGFGPQRPDNPFVVDHFMPAAWKGTYKQSVLRGAEMLVGVAIIAFVITRM